MQTKACTNNQQQNQPTVSDLVAALTPQEITNLRNFAAHRIARVARWPQMQRILAGLTPDDLVNSAITKYLVGDVHPNKGRVLKMKGRQSSEAFLHYLRGAINSELHNLKSSGENQGFHFSVSEEADQADKAPVFESLDPNRLLERRDLRRALFERLELLVKREPALAPVVRHWAAHFDHADRVAGPEFEENLVRRVRYHAREILKDLAAEIQPLAPTGIEVLI